jgi:ElaB/YqjD/DUF883 family membrane-anchored ribosome-binding protein
MIATPFKHQQQYDRPEIPRARAHAVAIENEHRRLRRRLERLIESQPELAIASAVTLGVLVGWLVKRKQW